LPATPWEQSSICASTVIIRNSANYPFKLLNFSFLLDKIDTWFEVSVTKQRAVTAARRGLCKKLCM